MANDTCARCGIAEYQAKMIGGIEVHACGRCYNAFLVGIEAIRAEGDRHYYTMMAAIHAGSSGDVRVFCDKWSESNRDERAKAIEFFGAHIVEARPAVPQPKMMLNQHLHYKGVVNMGRTVIMLAHVVDRENPLVPDFAYAKVLKFESKYEWHLSPAGHNCREVSVFSDQNNVEVEFEMLADLVFDAGLA